LGVKQHVPGLDISMDDVMPMEVLNCQEDLRKVEQRALLPKPPLSLQLKCQVALLAVLKREEEVGCGLKGSLESDDERVSGSCEDVSLSHGVGCQSMLLQAPFGYLLQRHWLPGEFGQVD
jgi:hypothetical protein